MTQQIRRVGVVVVIVIVVTHIVTIIFIIIILFVIAVVVVGSIQSAVTICMIRCSTARSTVHGQSKLRSLVYIINKTAYLFSVEWEESIVQ